MGRGSSPTVREGFSIQPKALPDGRATAPAAVYANLFGIPTRQVHTIALSNHVPYALVQQEKRAD